MQTGRDAFTPDLSVLREIRKHPIAAYKEGMPFDEYSERLNLAVSVTDDGCDPSGGGEQGGGDNGGTNQGNSGSMNGWAKGITVVLDAPEASGGNQEINSGQTDTRELRHCRPIKPGQLFRLFGRNK